LRNGKNGNGMYAGRHTHFDLIDHGVIAAESSDQENTYNAERFEKWM
jgi:hypothetical protein